MFSYRNTWEDGRTGADPSVLFDMDALAAQDEIPDHAACQKAVEEALEVGYRMIDTAASYMNEGAVGAAIKASGLPREEVFVTTKLWVQGHAYENTLKAFDTSMAKLGLDIFDFKLTDEDMALMSTLDRNEAAYDDRAVDIVKWISGTRIHD